MPYLLSILPLQTEEEKLQPLPLIAKLHSPKTLGFLYVNVLGGSKSRGGIALDPLVSSGRLTIGTKIDFAHLRQAYLPSIQRPNTGIHIHLEVLSNLRFRYKKGWKQAELKGPDRFVAVGFKRKQRFKNLPEFTENRRLDYQGIQMGLFSAGSEGGFLVGESGVVPWLCRTQGSRGQVQVTPHLKGERRVPLSTKPDHRVSTKGKLAYIEQKKILRKLLKEKGFVISKRVVFIDDRRWITVPFLRQKQVPQLSLAAKRVKAKMKANTLAQRKEKALRIKKLTIEKYNRRLRMWVARKRLRKLAQFKGRWIRHPGPPPKFDSKTGKQLSATTEKQVKSKKIDRPAPTRSLRPILLSELFETKEIPSSMKRLFEIDPVTQKLLLKRKERGITRYGGLFHRGGDRKFSFRARSVWNDSRPGGFIRSGHYPGGFELQKAIRWRTRIDAKSSQSSGEISSVGVRTVGWMKKLEPEEAEMIKE
jgi:hypothetical protein